MVVTSEREELGQREATESLARKQRGRDGVFHSGNLEKGYVVYPFCVRILRSARDDGCDESLLGAPSRVTAVL